MRGADGMEKIKKYGYDIIFASVLLYVIGWSSGEEHQSVYRWVNLFNPIRRNTQQDHMLQMHIMYVLIVMAITLLLGWCLREHIHIGTFTILACIALLFISIPNIFLCALGNMSAVTYDGEGVLGGYRYMSLNMSMLTIMRGVGIGICLLYIVGRTNKKISGPCLCQIVLLTGMLYFLILFSYTFNGHEEKRQLFSNETIRYRNIISFKIYVRALIICSVPLLWGGIQGF